MCKPCRICKSHTQEHFMFLSTKLTSYCCLFFVSEFCISLGYLLYINCNEPLKSKHDCSTQSQEIRFCHWISGFQMLWTQLNINYKTGTKSTIPNHFTITRFKVNDLSIEAHQIHLQLETSDSLSR